VHNGDHAPGGEAAERRRSAHALGADSPVSGAAALDREYIAGTKIIGKGVGLVSCIRGIFAQFLNGDVRASARSLQSLIRLVVDNAVLFRGPSKQKKRCGCCHQNGSDEEYGHHQDVTLLELEGLQKMKALHGQALLPAAGAKMKRRLLVVRNRRSLPGAWNTLVA
jgi:hypothetical protein